MLYFYFYPIALSLSALADPEGGGVRRTPATSQVVIDLPRNTSTDPPPSRSNWATWVQLFLEGGSYSLL